MSAVRLETRDVAVLGAGPAGVAAAVGLARLGYSIHLFAGPLRVGIEGASERTLHSLQRLGLKSAADCLRVRGPRARHWAGVESINGTEFLLDRMQFDQALRRDAGAADIQVREAWVSACDTIDDLWFVQSTGQPAAAFRAVVDARGRGARGPAGPHTAARGPSLLALTQRFTSDTREPGTAIVMGKERWCWFAQDGRGNLDMQMVCAPVRAGSRSALHSLLMADADLPPRFAAHLRSAKPVGDVRARASGSFLRMAAENPGQILAGDAAMALDPLSGHGIYEALASADLSVAALNTYLQGEDWSPVRRFVHERAQELWSRKAAAAQSFYQSAATANAGPFWAAMTRGYAELAANSGMLHDPRTQIQSRPVLDGVRIAMRRVLVAPRWPRGIWRYGDIEIAQLLDCCEPGDYDARSVASRLQRPPAAVQAALQWLSVQGALPAGGASGFTRTDPASAPMARSST